MGFRTGLRWAHTLVARVEAAGLATASTRLKILAPEVGFEPTTLRLTAGCSTIELLRNKCCRRNDKGNYQKPRSSVNIRGAEPFWRWLLGTETNSRMSALETYERPTNDS